MKTPASANKSPASKSINIHLLPANERTAARLRIYAAFKDEISATEATAKLHYKIQTVRRLYSRFETEGESAVHEKPHGLSLVNKSVFSPEERDILAEAIFHGNPHELIPGFHSGQPEPWWLSPRPVSTTP